MAGRYQAYPEYKDSGVEWLGEVPEHWVISPIKYVGKIKGGAGFPHLSQGVSGEELNFHKVNALSLSGGNDIIYESENTISRETAKMLGAYVFPAGSIVFAKVGAALLLGRIRVLALASCIDNNMMGLVVYTGSDTRFIKYSMSLVRFDYLVNPGAVPSFNEFQIGNFSIVLPIKEEQLQMSAFLDHETSKIDNLIEKQHKLIALLKEKRQAVISHAVTKGLNPDVPMKDSGVEWLGEVPAHWKVAKLRRSLLEHKQGYYTTAPYVDDGVKLLRITDLKDYGDVDITDCPMVYRTDTSLPNYELIEGDVVFARTGGAGTFGVIGVLKEEVVFASYLIRFRFKNEYVLHNYIKYQLLADSFQMSIKQNIHGGVNQNIHAEDIKNSYLTWPSINEQQQIASFLYHETAKIDTLINKANRSIELSKERRTALISAAVTGKIDVRDWQPPPTHRETK